ncbi:hypothetical protein C8Q76DRAFT_731026 [Earliella scabrosa]|nr:hypothetical protein C8Q76DRAFT_731026 [Earliella scabrosa]
MKSRLGIFQLISECPSVARVSPSSSFASRQLWSRSPRPQSPNETRPSLPFMADSNPEAASNSLGLDLDALKIKDDPAPADAEPPAQDASPSKDGASSTSEGAANGQPVSDDKDATESKKEPKEKKKPYVNPDRVKTGGAQREKPSEEELAERMARIREQNEKIKQRRADVQADEDEYKKMQEAERVKQAKAKKVQENVDKAREQNARRKLDKIQNREWDSGKPTREWNKPKKEEGAEDGEKKPQQSINIRGAVRGGGRGGGRGRGRGGGVTSPTSEKAEKKDAVPASTKTDSSPAPAETVAPSS